MPENKRLRFLVPKGTHILLRSIASINGEYATDVARRLLIVAVQEEASRVFRGQNFVGYAIKNDFLPDALIQEMAEMLREQQTVNMDEDLTEEGN